MRWWPWSKKQQAERKPSLMAGQDGYVFRRSRTLTGSTSANVAVSAERRGLLKTPRLKLHELRQHRLQILKIFGAVVLLIGIVVYIASVYIANPAMGVAQAGTNKPDMAAYSASAESYFETRPLERLGFALNPRSFEEYLKSKHPEVKNVSMDREWYGGNTHFTLTFREPLLTWTTSGQHYYVDSQGYAFSYNHFAEPAVSVTDESGISPDVGGGAVASGRFISFLGRMVGALNDYGKGRVESVTLPASTREIDLKLQGRGSLIRTHIDRDPVEQAEDIANALTYFDSKGAKPDYIDVRVSGKAFYK
jgi:hypothetical protein